MFIRNFKKAPWAFITAAAVLTLCEMTVLSADRYLSLDHSAWVVKEKKDLLKKGADTLILGDSDVLNGLNPLEISSAGSVVNLSVMGFESMGSYFMLQRYLKAGHPRPQLIILSSHPIAWGTPDFFSQSFFGAFVSPGELCSVWKDTKPEELKTFLNRIWQIKKRSRTLSRLPLILAGRHSQESFGQMIGDMRKHKGYMPQETGSLPMNIEHIETYRHFIAEARPRKYFNRLVKTAGREDIPLIYVIMPVRESIYHFWSGTGFWDDYQNYLKELRAEYPQIIFLSYPQSYISDRYFFDNFHLNPEGAKLVSRWLDGELRARSLMKQ